MTFLFFHVQQAYIRVVISLMMRNIEVRTAILYLLILVGWKERSNIILKPERRLRVFENSVLRRMFGLKRDEVTGDWRKLRDEELNDLYSSPDIIGVIK